MNVLNKYFPATRTGHMIKARPEDVLTVLEEHAQRTAQAARPRNSLSVQLLPMISEELHGALAALDPMVEGDFPTLQEVLETRKKGWVRVISNNLEAPGLPSRGAYLSKRLQTESVFFMFQPHMPGKGGESGATQFIYYKGGEKVRVVEVVFDDGWKFGASGEPFKFEATDRYKATDKAARFTQGMLVDMLAHFGLFPFDDSFYRIDANHPARGVALEVHSRRLLASDFKPVPFEKLKRLLPAAKASGD